jgi:4-hydroxy-3-methylbut-2-enyl diphosphate reductase
VLVTAGASAPEDLVDGVLDALRDRFGGRVEESSLMEEDVKFALPVQLRVLRHEMSQG